MKILQVNNYILLNIDNILAFKAENLSSGITVTALMKNGPPVSIAHYYHGDGSPFKKAEAFLKILIEILTVDDVIYFDARDVYQKANRDWLKILEDD